MSTTNKKTNSVTKTAGLFGVLVLFLGGIVAYSSFGSTQAYDESKTFPGANVKTIAIQVSDVDVHVLPSDSNEIRAHFHGQGTRDDYLFTMNETNGNLQVEVDNSKRFRFFTFGFEKGLTLDVEVPKHVYDQFTVNSSSGDIKMSALQAKTLQLTASSGDIELPQFQGEKLTATASSGDLSISGLQANADLHTNSGDIEAHNITGKSFSAISSSGKITLQHIEGDTSLQTSSGHVQVDDLKATHLKANSSSGDLDLTKISGAAVDAHSSSGDITLSVLDFLQNIQITTSSGDAKLAVPASSAFALDFQTGSGNQKIDFPITYATNDKHSVQGTVGSGGPTLTVHISSGSLSVLKN